jgi:SAM-dependent methyltransferase
MEKYLVDLFVASAQDELRAPSWLMHLYFSLFSPPLAKTFRIAMVKNMLRDMDLRGKCVLDVGCGIGDLSFMLAARGAEVIGIELAPQKVARARKIAQRWHFEGLRFLAADVTKLDQMNLGQFDAIFCLALLEHIPDDIALLRSLHSMLRPGGTLVLEVPNARRKTIAELEGADGHMRPGYLVEEISKLLADTGFRVTQADSRDPLGLIYYWCKSARLVPGAKAQRLLLSALAPPYLGLIRLTSTYIKRPGSELCFSAIRE